MIDALAFSRSSEASDAFFLAPRLVVGGAMFSLSVLGEGGAGDPGMNGLGERVRDREGV